MESALRRQDRDERATNNAIETEMDALIYLAFEGQGVNVSQTSVCA